MYTFKQFKYHINNFTNAIYIEEWEALIGSGQLLLIVLSVHFCHRRNYYWADCYWVCNFFFWLALHWDRVHTSQNLSECPQFDVRRYKCCRISVSSQSVTVALTVVSHLGQVHWLACGHGHFLKVQHARTPKNIRFRYDRCKRSPEMIGTVLYYLVSMPLSCVGTF